MDIEGNSKVDGELLKQAKEIMHVKENTPAIANHKHSNDQNVVEDDCDEPL